MILSVSLAKFFGLLLTEGGQLGVVMTRREMVLVVEDVQCDSNMMVTIPAFCVLENYL